MQEIAPGPIYFDNSAGLRTFIGLMSVLHCCATSVRKPLFSSSRAPPQAATKGRFGEPFSMLKIIFQNARGSLLGSRLEARGSRLQAQALSLQVRPRPPSPRLKVPRVYAPGSRLKAPGSRPRPKTQRSSFIKIAKARRS